jgi:hypothetical protein
LIDFLSKNYSNLSEALKAKFNFQNKFDSFWFVGKLFGALYNFHYLTTIKTFKSYFFLIERKKHFTLYF